MTNAIFQNAVDDIIQQENKKFNVKYETHENIDDEVDKDDLYKIDKQVLMRNNDVSVYLKAKNIYIYDINIPYGMKMK